MDGTLALSVVITKVSTLIFHPSPEAQPSFQVSALGATLGRDRAEIQVPSLLHSPQPFFTPKEHLLEHQSVLLASGHISLYL